ncbi:hypothetical protein Cal6303_2017 [Calothrix sp. PCC 6303]|nr:hypothetical protein Cal6303_2017 [Calothrix sp. PCC 6303]
MIPDSVNRPTSIQSAVNSYENIRLTYMSPLLILLIIYQRYNYVINTTILNSNVFI